LRVRAKEVDGAMFGRGHKPGAGIARNSGFRPALESNNQSILRQLLGKADIADTPIGLAC
jgi:hypothetical protein